MVSILPTWIGNLTRSSKLIHFLLINTQTLQRNILLKKKVEIIWWNFELIQVSVKFLKIPENFSCRLNFNKKSELKSPNLVRKILPQTLRKNYTCLLCANWISFHGLGFHFYFGFLVNFNFLNTQRGTLVWAREIVLRARVGLKLSILEIYDLFSV